MCCKSRNDLKPTAALVDAKKIQVHNLGHTAIHRCKSMRKITPITLSAISSLILSQESTLSKEIYLPLKEFDNTINHVSIKCTNAGYKKFSQGFYKCTDNLMEGIYFDSSSILPK